MKKYKKFLVLAFALVIMFSVQMEASAGGYHNIRKSVYKYKGIKSVLTIPQYYASSSLNGGTYPEFFFGFYNNGGLDIGLIQIDGGWKLFSWTSTNVPRYASEQWKSSTSVTSLQPGQQVQLHAYLTKVNTQYFIQVDLYDMNNKWLNGHKLELSSIWGSNVYTNGAVINRELSLASNDPNYLDSGAYFYNARWEKSWLIGGDGSWSPWTDALTASNRFLCDGCTPDPSRYSVNFGTTNGFAWDAGSIYFNK
jgi:hypothetical protein